MNDLNTPVSPKFQETKLLQVATPPLTVFIGTENNRPAAFTSSAHLQAAISIKTKMSTKE